ncbi:DNA mismatch repair protein MutS [compost metagenome]
MAVQESGEKVHFLRKLIPGAADSSYGIYCARLAGLPGDIIDRAYGLLQGFEQAAAATQRTGSVETAATDQGSIATEVRTEKSNRSEVVQLSIFGDEPPAKKSGGKASGSSEDHVLREIVNMVKDADLMNMTPLQAMQLINEMKAKSKHL